jgi:hypothetical protein
MGACSGQTPHVFSSHEATGIALSVSANHVTPSAELLTSWLGINTHVPVASESSAVTENWTERLHRYCWYRVRGRIMLPARLGSEGRTTHSERLPHRASLAISGGTNLFVQH